MKKRVIIRELQIKARVVPSIAHHPLIVFFHHNENSCLSRFSYDRIISSLLRGITFLCNIASNEDLLPTVILGG